MLRPSLIEMVNRIYKNSTREVILSLIQKVTDHAIRKIANTSNVVEDAKENSSPYSDNFVTETRSKPKKTYFF